jgi:hypothetical protein
MRNRFFSKSNRLNRAALSAILSAACLLMLLTACAPKKPIANQELHRVLATADPPRTVAVLPFGNRSDAQGLEELVRTSFYSHLSALAYQDVELHEVDVRLKNNGLTSPDSFSAMPAQNLGRLLEADAVIFGEVTEFERVFVGVYSQLSVGASITIYDTRNGRELWQDNYVSRFHEGGLPLDIISIPLITMRSGLNLRETVKLRAVDDLCRELVERLPAPKTGTSGADKASAYAYEVQTGSYLDEQLAIDYLATLRQQGFPAFIRRHQTSSAIWHRVLLGPYRQHSQALLAQEKVRREMKTDAYICRVPITNGANGE